MKKKALITGITGQDGSYLAELLLKKGYEVHGLRRRVSIFNTERIDHLYTDPHSENVPFFLHYGDLSDSSSINRIISKVRPDEIYNLAAQSHVGVSFEAPEYTGDIGGLGTLRILESIIGNNLQSTTKFYQASTSELYGKVIETPQNEQTPFYPRSPYAVAKLYSFWITKNYREAYSIFACNGILFNHESPRRGETFVTRKITIGLSKIVLGLQDILYLGNLYALRDWGHAKDYVEMMYLMMQQNEADDYVAATGLQFSVKDFINECLENLKVDYEWKGSGENETCYWKSKNKVIIKIDKDYFRPSEVDSLLGDSSKARNELNWNPKITFKELVKEMVISDYNKIKKLNED